MLYVDARHKNDIYLTTPHRWGHDIYNFGRPFLGHPYYILSLCEICQGVKKKDFTNIMQFQY